MHSSKRAVLCFIAFCIATSVLLSLADSDVSKVEFDWAGADYSASKKVLGNVCELANIGNQARNDKVDLFHNYQGLYCDLFRHMRTAPVRMLEIGFGCGHHIHGSSAIMWNQYFKNLRYYSIDYADANNAAAVHKCVEDFETEHPDILHHIWFGDQANVTFLQDIVKTSPEKKFDIIIDDAGHQDSQTLPSFQYLWPMVSYGGYYIVEDLVEQRGFAKQIAKWTRMMSFGADTARHGPKANQSFFDALPKHIKYLGCAFQLCYFKKVEPPTHHRLPIIWGENNTVIP